MKKVFIIEDSKEMSRVYERAFRLNGYVVEMAHDGQSALDRLLSAKDAPSAIIMDINMPGINGYDLLKRLRGEAALKDVPMVVLTNSFFKDDSEKFLSQGADLYLVKIEQDFTEIVGKIDKLIEDQVLKNKK